MINKVRTFKYIHTAPYSVDKHKNTYQSMFTYLVDDYMEIEGEVIKMQLTDCSHKNPNPNKIPYQITYHSEDKEYE